MFVHLKHISQSGNNRNPIKVTPSLLFADVLTFC